LLADHFGKLNIAAESKVKEAEHGTALHGCGRDDELYQKWRQ